MAWGPVARETRWPVRRSREPLRRRIAQDCTKVHRLSRAGVRAREGVEGIAAEVALTVGLSSRICAHARVAAERVLKGPLCLVHVYAWCERTRARRRGNTMARPFVWTPAKEEALRLEYAGRLTQAEIAAQLGVTRRTVEGWARRPAFRQRLQELVRAGLEELERRQRARQEEQRRQQLAAAAAADPFDVDAWLAERQAAWARRVRR